MVGPPYGRYVPGLALRSATPYRDVSGSFQSPPLHIARPEIPHPLLKNLTCQSVAITVGKRPAQADRKARPQGAVRSTEPNRRAWRVATPLGDAPKFNRQLAKPAAQFAIRNLQRTMVRTDGRTAVSTSPSTFSNLQIFKSSNPRILKSSNPQILKSSNPQFLASSNPHNAQVKPALPMLTKKHPYCNASSTHTGW
jgi:hypothetical protein